ncbi:dihydrofolate reductase family protein [Streptococcus phocae]|uniref:dihydrofolate reductase family protein n=1 Tax=Streptococcus phocae TaxID=119224 RepID=UPI000A5C7B6E|nr:dihydrofolate reductase family protein [Streptococcus phocae]
MAKLVLNIAMSLDGFIAREDGSYDWIRGHGTAAYDTTLQFDNQAFLDSCDTVVMGRKAFEACAIDEIDYFKTKKFMLSVEIGKTMTFLALLLLRKTQSG